MTLLRVLGSVSLMTAAGTEARSVTAQPKRVALLAYLACASHHGPVRRDTVLALFWPELDTAHARHALRQSLYVLRRELGAEVLEGNGDDALRVRPGALHCDVEDFRSALNEHAYERALGVYGGDLLPGLYIHGAVEFEQWLDGERAALRGQALRGAGELYRAAEREGRREDAVRWARRAHQFAPFDEAVLRCLLEALESAGDGSGAVLAYDGFAARLQRELRVAPCAETAAIVARIRAHRAQRRPRRPPADPASEPPPAEAAPAPRVPWRVRWRAAAAAVLLLSTLLVKWASRQDVLDPNLLAIPPFHVVTAGSDSVWLAEGIAELLNLDLQAGTNLRVVDGRAASARWQALARSPGASADPELPGEFARSLGAGLLLHGVVLERAGELVVTARLKDVRSGEVRGTATVSGRNGQLVELVGKVATRTLGALLHEDPHRLERLTSTSGEAVRAYLAGRAAMRRGEFATAYAHLNEALALDSTFAAAALAAVDAAGYSGLGGGGRYEQLAYRYRDRLTPRDTAHLRAWIGEAFTGRGNTRDLFDATEAAAAANPGDPQILYQLGDRFFHVGEFLSLPDAVSRSRRLFEEAVELDPGFTPAREHLIEVAVLTRDRKAVRRYRDELLRLEPNGDRTPYLRWLAAFFLRDGAELRRMRAAIDTMNVRALRLLVITAQEGGLGLADAERAAEVLRERAVSEADRAAAQTILTSLNANLGHIDAARRARPESEVTDTTNAGALLRILRLGLFSDAPPRSAPAAFAELQRRIMAGDTSRNQRNVRYGVLLWKLWHGDTTAAAAGISWLRDQEKPFGPQNGEKLFWVRRMCLEGLLEHASRSRHDRGPRPALERLDSLMRLGEEEAWDHNLVLVRIAQDLGQPQGALAAARRRLRNTGPSIQWLAPSLLVEARAAAALGDISSAAQAYRHYLALRTQPDPPLRALADSARREYQRLQRR